MNNKKIKELFLAAGFKEKDQGDGHMDLNPYVYAAAHLLIAEATKSRRELMQHHSRLHDLAIEKLHRYEKVGEDIVSGVNHKGWQIGTPCLAELKELTGPGATVFPPAVKLTPQVVQHNSDRYVAIELAGVMEEFLHMPCRSLEDRMRSTFLRYEQRIRAMVKAHQGFPELCQDEGCPHHGTDHICVTPKPRS